MEIKLRKRLIYAGDLWNKTFDCEEPGDFRKAIENAPSVDAVEVVRCKDCHNCTKSMWCNLLMMDVKGEWFCYHGERKDK
jgi:hypothetical protein